MKPTSSRCVNWNAEETDALKFAVQKLYAKSFGTVGYLQRERTWANIAQYVNDRSETLRTVSQMKEKYRNLTRSKVKNPTSQKSLSSSLLPTQASKLNCDESVACNNLSSDGIKKQDTTDSSKTARNRDQGEHTVGHGSAASNQLFTETNVSHDPLSDQLTQIIETENDTSDKKILKDMFDTQVQSLRKLENIEVLISELADTNQLLRRIADALEKRKTKTTSHFNPKETK